ncbi:polysaccharide pyruvyl transferase family protein [Rhodococcus sp. WAY2]|uniref:polysaccharide pyruvyl transferase family protein n=1 Tax=Rhodococcus sp. WAY2 TaxID=2663121 RepID=UPI0022A888DC|nr:polysaccharide pyruvyl transferase family protein [Rhodococcus sp. WAY2]
MQKVLILWADQYSSNLGVQALAEGTRCLANVIAPGAEIVFRSYGHEEDRRLRLGARTIGSALVGANPELRRWIAQFDLVIDTGAGDSFADLYGIRRLAEMSALRKLISNVGVPFIMGPQTVGPFQHWISRILARESVRGASAVIARDSTSAERALSIYEGKIALGSDVVFLLDQPEMGPSLDVVLNVSGLLWNKNPHVDWKFYRESTYRFADAVQSQGRGLALLAHVIDSPSADNDLHAVEGLRAELKGDVEVIKPDCLNTARSVLAGAKVVVASRMHAALNALSTGVPAVAWAYSRKFEPLLSDLGWPHLHDLRSLDPTIVDNTLVVLDELIAGRSEVDLIREKARNRFNRIESHLSVEGVK